MHAIRTPHLRIIGGPGLSILPGSSARLKEHPGCKMWYHLTYLTPHPSARFAHRLVWSRMAGRTAGTKCCKRVSTTSEISLRAAAWSTTARWRLCRYIEGRVCRLQGAAVYKTQDWGIDNEKGQDATRTTTCLEEGPEGVTEESKSPGPRAHRV